MDREKLAKRFSKMSDAEKEVFIYGVRVSPKKLSRLEQTCADCEALSRWEDLFNIGVEGISVLYPESPCAGCVVGKVLAEASHNDDRGN